MELSNGKKAVLQRARLLTEFEWTPLRDIPVFTKAEGKTALKAGALLKGMIYSSTEPTDKFVCENISFETFRSIVNNKDSAIYEKDLGGHSNSWAYFGVVCNGFVRFALGLEKLRYSTKRWYDIPGMQEIAKPEAYTVDEFEICDILYAFGNGRNHVALITNITKDENGKVIGIEVSEAIRPVCVKRTFTPEEYYEVYKLFGICRYAYIDYVPEPEADYLQFFPKASVSENPALAVDYGTKSNYRTNEDVVISASGEVEILKDGALLETISVSGKTSKRFERGYYEIIHTATGEKVYFCVTEPQITHNASDGVITVNANAGDGRSKIHHFEFREAAGKKNGMDYQQAKVSYYNPSCASLSKMEILSDKEKETGIIVREIPADAENYKVYFENEYGVWTHTMIKI